MTTITQLGQTIWHCLGPQADQLGWQTGFNQRSNGKLSGSAFVQTLVFSALEDGALTYTRLSAGALAAGVSITPQGLEQRFSRASADLCQGVLSAVVGQVIRAQPLALPLLERFAGLFVRDSCVVGLPTALQPIWAGVGGSQGSSSAVKLHVRLELRSGELAGPVLAPGRQADSRSPFQSEALPVGAVRLGDLGFFSLRQFARDQRAGVYTLSRYKVGTLLYDEQGQPIDLLAWLRQQTAPQFERTVRLGRRQRLVCRLLVERVPQAVVEQRRRKLREYARKKQVEPSAELLALAEWTLLITTIPPELLSIPEALVLMALRWQIELLFKRWKSLLLLDEWRSAKPWRILTELYAKLIAAVLLHWTMLVELWGCPERSLWKAALMVRGQAIRLAHAFPDRPAFLSVLLDLQGAFQHLCRLNPRRARPNAYQRLLDPLCTTLA